MGMVGRGIAVFLGPSCTEAEARAILPGADYFPPASRGSIYGIINDGYRMIVLIDGLFYGKFSVWHKELLFAMDCGIDVIGATSMGALRAAELDRAGMIGVGQIYRWYRDGIIDGDDEVALLHQSSEGGYLGLTLPLVTLRWNLGRAVQAGVIGSAQHRQVLQSAAALCFQERTLDAILAPFAQVFDIAALTEWLDRHGEDLKHRDTIEALDFAALRMQALGPMAAPRLRAYEHVHAGIGISYFMAERHQSICAKSDGAATPLAQIKRCIDPDDPRHGAFVRARAFQRLVNGWARELHLPIPARPVPAAWQQTRFSARMRQATGLTLIDIAREGQEAALTAALLDAMAPPQASEVVAAIGRLLAARGWDKGGFGQDIARLDGRLVLALWRLGQAKGIHADDASGSASAEMALAFADRIFAGGLQRFGLTFDPAAEVLLACQHADRLSDIAQWVAS